MQTQPKMMLAYKDCTLATKCVERAALLMRWEEFGKGRGNRVCRIGTDHWRVTSGQSGKSYEVETALVDGLALAICNCRAGERDQFCHHATSALWAAGGLQWVMFDLAVIELPEEPDLIFAQPARTRPPLPKTNQVLVKPAGNASVCDGWQI